MNSEFPVEIDLGREIKDMPMPANAEAQSGKRGKPRKFYPTLYIEAVPGLEDLPKEGCIMVKYRRTRLSVETPEDGDDKAGVTLEIHRICMPKDMEEEGRKDLASVMDGKMDGDESHDDEDDDGE